MVRNVGGLWPTHTEPSMPLDDRAQVTDRHSRVDRFPQSGVKTPPLASAKLRHFACNFWWQSRTVARMAGWVIVCATAAAAGLLAYPSDVVALFVLWLMQYFLNL